jgi:hypothetical protein
MLGETQTMLRDYPAAIAAYEAALALIPGGDPQINARLEWLRSQR